MLYKNINNSNITCGYLNENGSHRLIIEWFPSWWAVLKGLDNVTLMEKVCHWGWALRSQIHMPGPVSDTVSHR